MSVEWVISFIIHQMYTNGCDAMTINSPHDTVLTHLKVIKDMLIMRSKAF